MTDVQLLIDHARLENKHKRIEYLYSKGRISEEEYEKWILSDDRNYEPKVMSTEEVTEKFKLDWGKFQNQPLMWVADPHQKTHELLEKILEKLEEIRMEI